MFRLTVVALALLFVGSIADVPAMFLAVRGMLPLSFIFIAGFLADILPDFLWYWMGQKIGLERISKIKFFRQDPKRIDRADRVFHKYGGWILFFSKFVYLFGIPTQIVAGAHRYNKKKWFVANALGALGWLVLLYYLAVTFTRVDFIENELHNVQTAFLAFVAAAFLFHFLLGAPLKRMIDRS